MLLASNPQRRYNMTKQQRTLEAKQELGLETIGQYDGCFYTRVIGQMGKAVGEKFIQHFHLDEYAIASSVRNNTQDIVVEAVMQF